MSGRDLGAGDAPSEAEEAVDIFEGLDAPPENQPQIEGFGCGRELSAMEVRMHLMDRGNYDPREVDNTVLASVRFEDTAPPDAEGRLLGSTLPTPGHRWGDGAAHDVTIHQHDGATGRGEAADRLASYKTLDHEIGHTVWANAPAEMREQYERDVYDWSQQNPPREGGYALPELGDDVAPRPGETGYAIPASDYASKNAEEHFCEAMAMAINEPEKLELYDRYAPEGANRTDWVAGIRAAALEAREERASRSTSALA
ncbi:hypothetical protein LBMAG42_56500 [Deltaproteobacteria bacterium]|nr:hypothetical protein LBMAG42_56500 [Deltaproteobacteria bacterium]